MCMYNYRVNSMKLFKITKIQNFISKGKNVINSNMTSSSKIMKSKFKIRGNKLLLTNDLSLTRMSAIVILIVCTSQREFHSYISCCTVHVL